MTLPWHVNPVPTVANVAQVSPGASCRLDTTDGARQALALIYRSVEAAVRAWRARIDLPAFASTNNDRPLAALRIALCTHVGPCFLGVLARIALCACMGARELCIAAETGRARACGGASALQLLLTVVAVRVARLASAETVFVLVCARRTIGALGSARDMLKLPLYTSSTLREPLRGGEVSSRAFDAKGFAAACLSLPSGTLIAGRCVARGLLEPSRRACCTYAVRVCSGRRHFVEASRALCQPQAGAVVRWACRLCLPLSIGAHGVRHAQPIMVRSGLPHLPLVSHARRVRLADSVFVTSGGQALKLRFSALSVVLANAVRQRVCSVAFPLAVGACSMHSALAVAQRGGGL